MTGFRLPNITADTTAGRLQQVQSYLYRLVEQLNMVIDREQGVVTAAPVKAATPAQQKEAATVAFNQVKALIIKSADIVNAYYETINKRLEGQYVAQSDFGTYREQTALQIQANSQAVQQLYTDLRAVIDQVGEVESSIVTNAYINSGQLYEDENGIPVYGLEIGQRTQVDGAEVFNKYARFTANKLSFYDANGYETAWISDRMLYIKYVRVTVAYAIGGFVDTVLPGGGVVTKYVGGG